MLRTLRTLRTLVTTSTLLLAASAAVAEADRQAAANKTVPTAGERPLPAETFSVLRSARHLAALRLQKRPQCSELFTDLGADGFKVLHETRYLPASRGADRQVCDRPDVLAFTRLRSARVWICVEKFSQLDRYQAAMALIHEGLHQAGLSEHHADPAAPTPREINRTVRKACSL